jgi:hypothetical protein
MNLESVEKCRDSDLSESERWTDLKVCSYGMIHFSPILNLHSYAHRFIILILI